MGSNGSNATVGAWRAYHDSLGFRLPPFLRLAWATPAARDRWSAPLGRLAHEVRNSEWLAVAAGVREAAIIAVPRAQSPTMIGEWSRHGLASLPLSPGDAVRIHALNGKTRNPGSADEVHLVTRGEWIGKTETMWRQADIAGMAGKLGYPPCCAAFLQRVAIEQDCIDTTWAMIRGPFSHENGPRIAEIAGPLVNPLLSPLGLRAVPHRPCSFHCEATRQLANVYTRLRAGMASQPDKDSLEQVLDWPMEWSSLHAIVEVTLPVFKLCYDGDGTATTYKVRLMGGALPAAAASGLAFPHRPIERPG